MHLKSFCTSTVMSYSSGSGGNAFDLSTTTTIIPESQEQLNSYQSNGSVGDFSDISTLLSQNRNQRRGNGYRNILF